jgi:large subunit ribosomal protein L1
METKKPEQALAELRNGKERKFDQSVDLIVNLRGVDVKRDNINIVSTLPHNVKKKKVAGFFKEKRDNVDTILESDFAKYKDKDLLKNLVEGYDFFIAQADLMPRVATTFGKVLGPAGKMPSPQLGILPGTADEKIIQGLLDKISKSVKIRAKEASIKFSIGKISMDDKDLLENLKAGLRAVIDALPVKKENVKNASIKLTMSKPVGLEI